VRVLYSFPDTIGKPGIGTTAFNQAAALAEIGVEVFVIATSAARHAAGWLELQETLSLFGRRVPHRALGIARSYRYHDRRVARRLASLGREVDLVHSWPRATLETAAVAHRLGIPLLREVPNTHTAHAYEVSAAEHAALGIPPVPGSSHSPDAETLALEEAEYDAAEILLVPSEYARGTFLERGYPAEKLALHRYGYEPELFYPAGAAVDVEAPLRVVFAGRCEPRKGLHLALRAWVESGVAERGRFLICGEFVPGYREVLGDWLEHPSVEVRTFTPNLPEFLRASHVLLLPSIEEGSALVTYEAQGSGCALLVSEAAGARCTHLVQGLVHPTGDVATLTEHLRLLDNDRKLLESLRAGARKQASKLTWRAAAEDLQGIYADAVDTARSSAARASS
jgi:glycosyltransferase involved in cell wall biosynthesis